MPGESYLAALDAMGDSPIEISVCRQEAGAGMMALTEGRLTAGREPVQLREIMFALRRLAA